MLTIERILVAASLDDPTTALERARQEAGAGDESWGEWVAEYDRGDALIVRLDVALEAKQVTLEVSNRGVFIEAHPHVPKVEQQIAELVSKDFSALAEEMSKMGDELGVHELCEMYVHVELADDPRATATSSESPRASAGAPRARGRPVLGISGSG
jgi:hypothetical protein